MAPWFGNDNEFEWRTSYTYQSYDQLDTRNGSSSYSSDDHKLSLSLGLATMGKYHAEVEMDVADTKERDLSFESLAISGRYLWSNDIVGDPFSSAFGATLRFSPSSAHRDPSSFRHAHCEGEVYASVGREKSKSRTWNYRYWGVLGLGVANRGNPWAHGGLFWEKNIRDDHRWRVFADARRGFGNRDLTSAASFPGYRSLGYHAVDVGLRYSYSIEFWGTLMLEYSRRVHVKYAPKEVDKVMACLLIPFSL